MGIVDDVAKTLSVKIKPRHDSYTDQFSRIVMMKVMMMAALMVGLNWYADKIACIIPATANLENSGGMFALTIFIDIKFLYIQGTHTDFRL